MPSSLRMILPVIAMVPLAACATAYAPTVSATRCDPARHQALVGMNIGEVYLPPQLHYREISPGQIVTQEYQPGRLNIFLDPKGWIARVSCG
ncbi:I78 family peptidase inhibitor [Paracoccus sp. WLY502]|uniref:I78 family peptidase inhibitor n=1 Tax=Paracoccus yibinensis TaxID=3068891 RepID=UPI0027967384|nr:I78 family peptidase inhibitor [Paracoccus sp. WLY502]MDQ1899116.1 I78 family peptidase inhibitor [Paracoccus sp. WLY502]